MPLHTAGLGFRLERAEMVQNLSSAWDAFLAMPGRERCGCSRQNPQTCSIPCESIPGVWLRDCPGLGIGGIKIVSLGKRDGIPLVVSCEVSTSIPVVLGKEGSLFLLLHCPSFAGKSWWGAPPPSAIPLLLQTIRFCNSGPLRSCSIAALEAASRWMPSWPAEAAASGEEMQGNPAFRSRSGEEDSN